MKRLIIAAVIGAVTTDLTWVAVMWWLERPGCAPRTPEDTA